MTYRLLIVRHGETDWNVDGRIQGHSDVSLSERGRAQAGSLRRRLEEWEVHAAYSSDLKRASQTAEALLTGRSVTLCSSAELREFSFGLWEGLTFHEVQQTDPAMYAEMMSRSEEFAPPGGESLKDVTSRIGGFVSGLRHAMFSDDGGEFKGHYFGNEPQDHTTLIVGHGGSLRALLVCLLGLPTASTWSFMLDNVGLSVVDLYPDNAVLKLFNDTSHLEDGRYS